MCARPAVPASVYQIVAGRSFHGTTAGRAFTSVGDSKTKIKPRRRREQHARNVGLQISRHPDTTASLVATARKAQADGWPPLSPHALTRVRMPVVSRRRPGQSPAAAVRPGSAHGTNQSHLSSVQRGPVHGRFVNAKFDRAGVQDPAAGAAHGGHIGSEKISTFVRGS